MKKLTRKDGGDVHRGDELKAAVCPVCAGSLGPEFASDFAQTYPGLVCRRCDSRALDAAGEAPDHTSEFDGGTNPVFIDGRKAWRRYSFGGFVTMVDPHDCPSWEVFFERTFGSR
jgi:hypothetical protein